MSLLPWRVLYFISDCFYALVYYVIGYRKDVVMKNLTIAFPEKTEKEKKRIAKDFYRKFIDTFIETIKLLSVSKEQFRKRITTNVEQLDELYATGQSVIFAAGHFFNWEFANLTASGFSQYPFVGIYKKVSNKAFDALIYKLRSKFGTILISTDDFRKEYINYSKMQHSIGLIADQNPTNPAYGAWYPFFGKMAPFLKGPEKTAKSLNAAIALVNFYQERRGHYNINFILYTTTPKDIPEGEITKTLVHFVEDCIRRNPSNYLWSHRRWKHEFSEEKYGHLVIK
jgi:Kdo2-lipid IVA lauroyltransferase/acyltransferase